MKIKITKKKSSKKKPNNLNKKVDIKYIHIDVFEENPKEKFLKEYLDNKKK